MDNEQFQLNMIERLSKIEVYTAAFKDHLVQDIEISTDIYDKLNSIDKILERNTDSLEQHMKRTALLESEIESRVTPIEKHITEVNGALKLIKVLVWVAAAIGTIAGAFQVFK